MPDSDEHENDIYEDEEVELSDDDPPAPTVGTFNFDLNPLAPMVHLIGIARSHGKHGTHFC